MKDIVLNPDPRVCCSVICLYVYGLESLCKFVVQYCRGFVTADVLEKGLSRGAITTG